MAVDPNALVKTLRQARGTWLLAAGLLLPLNLFLDGWVWSRFLKTVKGVFPPRAVGTAVLSGLALGFWTPARIGEYAGRAFAFPDADRWTLSVTVFAQRMLDMAVGVGIGLILLAGAIGSGVLPATAEWLCAAGIGLGTTTVLATLIGSPSRLHRYTNFLGNWASTLQIRTAFLRRLTFEDGAQVVGGTVARYFVFTGQFVLLGMALDPSQSPFALSAAVGLTFYAKYLIPSLTLLDLGIREGGAVVFFSVLGLDPAVGLSASLCLFSLNVLLPAVIGIPFLSALSLPDGQPAPAEEGMVASTVTDS